MFKWLIIGVVCWYFYRRMTRPKTVIRNEKSPYIDDRDHNREEGIDRMTRIHPEDPSDDYIDYEEVD